MRKLLLYISVIVFAICSSAWGEDNSNIYVGLMVNSSNADYKEYHDSQWQRDTDYRINIGKNYNLFNLNFTTELEYKNAKTNVVSGAASHTIKQQNYFINQYINFNTRNIPVLNRLDAVFVNIGLGSARTTISVTSGTREAHYFGVTISQNVGFGFRKNVYKNLDIVFHQRYAKYGKFEFGLADAGKNNWGVQNQRIRIKSIDSLIKIQYNF